MTIDSLVTTGAALAPPGACAWPGAGAVVGCCIAGGSLITPNLIRDPPTRGNRCATTARGLAPLPTPVSERYSAKTRISRARENIWVFASTLRHRRRAEA